MGPAKSHARNIFGIERIRAGRAEVLDASMAGKDMLAITPTGSGKSQCYQLATLSVPSTTVNRLATYLVDEGPGGQAELMKPAHFQAQPDWFERAGDFLRRRRIPESLHAYRLAEKAGHSRHECAAGRWMLGGDFESAWRESDAIERSQMIDPNPLLGRVAGRWQAGPLAGAPRLW